jgi:hypothetical protein
MRSLTHSLIMRHDSWHARWYRHWLKLGGTRKSSRENLCHYVRVLLFWAPMRWFAGGSVLGMPPYVLAVVLFYLTMFYLGSIVLGIILTAMVVVGASVLLLKRRKPERFKKIVLQLKFGVDRLVKSRIGTWYFNELYFGFRFTPFGITASLACAAALALGIVFFPSVILKTAIIVAAFALVVCGIVGIETFVEKMKKRRKAKKSTVVPLSVGSQPGLGRRITRGTADTARIGATYVRSKKTGSRICPFIEFEEPL